MKTDLKNRNIPFGYRFEDGKIIISSDEHTTLQRICSEYLDGRSLLQIANGLQTDKVEFAPGITTWNKVRIMRIVDDDRYLGNDIYPQLIDEATLERMRSRKTSRNTQSGTDRRSGIYLLKVPIICPSCCEPMRSLQDTRCKCTQKWVCSQTYIRDCLSKKVMINNGERPKYYVENNHPAIIDSGTFGRVQEEMARRCGKRKVKQVGTKTEQGRYSSKYALTELLICGECGTPYRRCTWAANGKKKVVWRCINRLGYGKKYCHDSPSIEESVLQDAIMNAVLQTAKQNVEVLKTLKLHIGMGLSAETTEDNSLDLQIRIAEIEAEFQKMLKAIAADNVEAFDEEKAKALMDEKAKLQIQLDRIADTKQKRENAKSRLDEIFVILEALANHPISYDDQIIRQILESVIVESKDRIKVVFIGGLEVTQLI